ncbi:MAG: tripartite tricarboxylate transporter substrate binding protein [Betaproteobacteria bacterium]|nr:tripartite tricarboxylate transporter substrate binding protein [Betaproteobacteria bacterium]
MDAGVLKMKVVLSTLALAAFSGAAAAQAFPTKPMRIIVPFAPGGATDVLARTFGGEMQKHWGQTVVVENKPGAGGNIGAEAGAKAAPDGYTLTLVAHGFMSVNPHVYKNLGYDSVRDFAPVTQLVDAPLLLVVNPNVPIKSVREFVDYAKANPGKLVIGNGGAGTAQHLAGELLTSMAGIKALHVPYKGSAPATTDLLGGQTQAQLDNMVTFVSHVKAGKLRPLGVSSAKRAALFPDVPTIAEAGVPGYESGTWYGVTAAGGTPADVVAKINAELVRIMKQPEIAQKLADMGLVPVGSSPEQFGAFIRAQRELAGKLVKQAGLPQQ